MRGHHPRPHHHRLHHRLHHPRPHHHRLHHRLHHPASAATSPAAPWRRCTKLRIWWHLPEKKLRLAFCDRPSLELDDTHIQLPLFQPCIKKGLGDCQPLSHPAVVARVLESILAMVFKEKKPPRFDLRKKVSHWRTVRMIYQWYGAKGLKWRSQGAYHRLLNPQHELAQSALAEGLTGKRKKGIAQANWRALLLHAKKN